MAITSNLTTLFIKVMLKILNNGNENLAIEASMYCQLKIFWINSNLIFLIRESFSYFEP